MRFRIFALLIMGVVLAVIAGFATFSYTRGIETRLTGAQAAVAAFGDTIGVPVARRDIPRGSLVTAADFDTLSVPAQHIPGNLLRAVPDPGPEQQIMALSDLQADALLSQDQIGTATGPDYAFALSPDGRGVAVSPRNLKDYREFIAPGALVDLFWTHSIGGGSTETRLLARGLKVLHGPYAMPQREREAAGAEALILEAGLQDAARLLEAGQSGHFHILPTGRLSSEPGQLAEVSVGPEDLSALPLLVRRPAGGSSGDPVPEAGLSGCHTAVVRGARRSIVEVPC